MSSFENFLFNSLIFFSASDIAELSGIFNLSIKGWHILSNSSLVISTLISVLSNILFILKVVLSDELNIFFAFSQATFNLFTA